MMMKPLEKEENIMTKIKGKINSSRFRFGKREGVFKDEKGLFQFPAKLRAERQSDLARLLLVLPSNLVKKLFRKLK